jgi:superfamily I DNA/RNA helicase
MGKKVDFGNAVRKARANEKKGCPRCGKELRKGSTCPRCGHNPANPPHIAVDALAGTGKTFSLVVGVAYLFATYVWESLVDRLGFEPEPSAQQGKIWRELVKGPAPRTITYLAFNKSIVKEFGKQWAWLVSALKAKGVFFAFKTCHSLGFAACCKPHGIGTDNINRFKTRDLLERELGVDLREYKRTKGGEVIISAVCQLVSKCKMNLVHLWEMGPQDQAEALGNLCVHYEIELNGQQAEVFRLVPILLQAAREETSVIDFDDQIWLPIVNDLPVFQSDLVLGDEAQDWNKCQQALILKAVGDRGRLVLVGDVNQAIYGFAGADIDSIPRMKAVLESTSRGLVTCELTATRRCSKAVVRDCRQLVPAFEAFPSNAEGEVRTATVDEMLKDIRPGDLMLCRTNAPLIEHVFKLVKAGKKANINGRDIGDGLISLIDKLQKVNITLCPKGVEDFVAKLDGWYSAEAQKINARKHPDEEALIRLQDKQDMILMFMEGEADVNGIKTNIKTTFSDPDRKGILGSSIHRAKGLEAPRVWIIRPGLIPHPMAKTPWAHRQEINLDYVARSRAIETLIRVDE